jgi:NAD(P)H-dependent flavin oxidoreductase YrpB (nitropropane dioxygenase family)
LRDDYKQALLTKVIAGDARVVTDSLASPTGFPFKVAQLEGTLSERDVYSARPRICDLGYLREAYKGPDGKIAYRCPCEPVSVYFSKGGQQENTVGRTCLCNALVATIGHPQVRSGRYVERGIVDLRGRLDRNYAIHAARRADLPRRGRGEETPERLIWSCAATVPHGPHPPPEHTL